MAELETESGALTRRVLEEADIERLLAAAVLLEADRHGPKVYRLRDGRVLKLFRIKRFWSSHLWSPYGRRFVENAHGLSRLGFSTVRPRAWGVAPSLGRQFVLYEYLEGAPAREALADAVTGAATAALIGSLLGRLHRRGVLFRSVHLGNLLVLPGGDEAGLIDIMSIRFRAGARPLTFRQRRRNFVHLLRYREDRRMLASRESAFRSGYEAGWEKAVPERRWKGGFAQTVTRLDGRAAGK